MRIALVFRGHFRTFDRTAPFWELALDGCEYDSYFHTWDTIDANTVSWHCQKAVEHPKLTEEQVALLKKWDPNVVIETQTFTEEEHKEIYASWAPHKALVYRMNAFLQLLKRIPKEKYDLIVVSRYDIKVKEIPFHDIQFAPNEVLVGGRSCPGCVGNIAVSDVLFAFPASYVDKLYNPLEKEGINPKKYTNCEEWFNEMLMDVFETFTHKWQYTEHFDFCRLGGA